VILCPHPEALAKKMREGSNRESPQRVWVDSDGSLEVGGVLGNAPEKCAGGTDFIGKSPAFNSILELIKAIAARKCSVVITGELLQRAAQGFKLYRQKAAFELLLAWQCS